MYARMHMTGQRDASTDSGQRESCYLLFVTYQFWVIIVYYNVNTITSCLLHNLDHLNVTVKTI